MKTVCGEYRFDFTASGFFTLVDSQGEPFYDQALPFFEKAVAHLIWIFFWLTFIIFTHIFLPSRWQTYLDRILMSIIFAHLFLLGCRLTTLLLKKGLKPILFPPLWIKITRKLQKKPDIQILQKKNLDTHPGLLSNLAIIEYLHGDVVSAQTHLNLALNYAPNHPALTALISCIK